MSAPTQKLELVRWADAFGSGEWTDVDEAIEDHGRWVCHSVGFVIAEDDNGIVLAATLSAEDRACNWLRIPRGMIQYRTQLTTLGHA